MKHLKFNNLIGISALIASLIFLFSIYFVINMGNWLVITDPLPEKVDIIFTFAGENVRVAYSKELSSRYPNSFWILSDYKNGYSRLLRKSNYDMSRVHIIDTCQNTVSEVSSLDNWIKQHASQLKIDNTLSIGLVSSPYHMRRIKLMVERQFKEHKINFYFLPVPLQRYKWTEKMFQYWWKTGSISRVVISEFQKIIYFILIS